MKRQHFLSALLVLAIVPLLGFSFGSSSQKMSVDRLFKLLEKAGKDFERKGSMCQFEYKGRKVMCFTDAGSNRMRLVSFITRLDAVSEDDALMMLGANFHTALDARYAISKGAVYSAFIHPLRSLTAGDLRSGVHQVATLADNYGTSWDSGGLIFGAGQ